MNLNKLALPYHIPNDNYDLNIFLVRAEQPAGVYELVKEQSSR